MKSRIILLASLLALLIPTAVFAQSTAQEPDVNDLQKQLQQMREQMTTLQARIEEMEKAKAKADSQPAQDQTPIAQKVASPAKPAAPKSPTTFTSERLDFQDRRLRQARPHP